MSAPTMETAIRSAATLYDMRSTARTILGDRYAGRIAEMTEAIESLVVNKGLSPIQAAIALGKAAQEGGHSIALLVVMSALVEMTEERVAPPQADPKADPSAA